MSSDNDPAGRPGVLGGRRAAHNQVSSRPREKLTVAEVCADLGISRSTFYAWRASGKAPRCIRLPNGDLRVRRVDLDSWLADLEDVA
jgi:excisionase family DNA binding protein